MSSLFDWMFGSKPEVDYTALIKDGAQLVDVRTPAEFLNGHIDRAVNLPLQKADALISSLRKDKAVIVYCASGNRSQQARKLLESNGFREVYDAGGYLSLKKILG